ncbi:MAG TPA: type II toxin-antitoxin system Phd/YefM family antitoxin [Candidatus Saccharimonadales bacterium]|nr:type II toxin-antitoxin system Phd/YefM family antitoxin [Candidatus Saccharimonadales bacterium]
MKTVSIHDAKTNLSKYIAAAKRGEKIYIGGFGEPEVALINLSLAERGNRGNRSFNIAKGKIKVTPEAFSKSTEQQVANLMLGN